MEYRDYESYILERDMYSHYLKYLLVQESKCDFDTYISIEAKINMICTWAKNQDIELPVELQIRLDRRYK